MTSIEFSRAADSVHRKATVWAVLEILLVVFVVYLVA